MTNEKMFSLDKWVDTSQQYDDPIRWIAHSIGAYTTLMSLSFPKEFRSMTWSQKRDALKEALMEVQLPLLQSQGLCLQLARLVHGRYPRFPFLG